jgi:hypothetical protein
MEQAAGVRFFQALFSTPDTVCTSAADEKIKGKTAEKQYCRSSAKISIPKRSSTSYYIGSIPKK